MERFRKSRDCGLSNANGPQLRMTTSVSETTTLAAIASQHREHSAESPRNLWSKLASATHHLARGDAVAAQEGAHCYHDT